MMNQYADAVRTFQTFELACQWYEKTLKDTGIPKDGELRPSVISAYLGRRSEWSSTWPLTTSIALLGYQSCWLC